ncbi:MAG: hypothetical protein ACK4TF_10180 [Thermodesulfovibrionales bacterium]
MKRFLMIGLVAVIQLLLTLPVYGAQLQKPEIFAQLGHGLFTYVLTEGMKGKADTDGDGFIKTLELAAYVDSEVPALAERVFKKAQYPTAQPIGQSFPVGKVR